MGAESAEASVAPPFGGVDAGEWEALVARGKADGELHADQIAHVLRHVELTGDALHAVNGALTGAGIKVDETVHDEEDDETPPRGAAREVVLDDEDVERLLTRRRR